MLETKRRRSRDAPGVRPITVSCSQASSMYLRKFASAFGAGSVATTSKPRARYCAAQLAPMTPVPTIVIRRMGLLNDIIISPLKIAIHAASIGMEVIALELLHGSSDASFAFRLTADATTQSHQNEKCETIGRRYCQYVRIRPR